MADYVQRLAFYFPRSWPSGKRRSGLWNVLFASSELTSGLPVIRPLELADRKGPAPDMLAFMSRSKAFVGRAALCVCGAFSILVGRTYGTLRLFYPSDRWVSTVFSVTLVSVGIALRLNQRPRKTLEFQTPASKLQASVAPLYGKFPVWGKSPG